MDYGPQGERAVAWQEATHSSELLDEAIRRYQNRNLSTAEIIAELAALARNRRGAQGRGVTLGLRDDELAFYDAIFENQAAVLELGDDILKTIARELITAVRESATIDWNLKETVCASDAGPHPTPPQPRRLPARPPGARSPAGH
jgi:type I restriction enzyme R subunit